LIRIECCPRRIAAQRFEAVAGRRPQVRQPGCRSQHIEFPQGHGPDRLPLCYGVAAEQRLGALVLERSDHPRQI
jgi:hypothetical protein